MSDKQKRSTGPKLNNKDSEILQKAKLRDMKLEEGRRLFREWELDTTMRTNVKVLRSSMFYEFALSYFEDERKTEMKPILKKVWREMVNEGAVERRGKSSSFSFADHTDEINLL